MAQADIASGTMILAPPDRTIFIEIGFGMSPVKDNSFCGSLTDEIVTTEAWIYHNSFSGGLNIYGGTSPNLPKVRYINNIHSSNLIFDTQKFPGVYANNFDSKIWNDATLPDFILPSTSGARNTAINLSQSFSLNNVLYSALPGMFGYYLDSTPDIGAMQFGSAVIPLPPPPPPPTPTPLAGDLNGDRTVNSIDFSIMNSAWLTNNATSDLNKDGTVNSLDFSIMNGNWLKTY
jgi:hypothetical protein